MSKIKDSSIIKGIQSQIAKAEADLEILKIQKNTLVLEMNNKNNQINNLKQKLKNIQDTKNITVSEHAILRYLERVEGLDMNQIISKISTDNLKSMVDVLGGNGIFPIDGLFSVKVKDHVIVSVFV